MRRSANATRAGTQGRRVPTYVRDHHFGHVISVRVTEPLPLPRDGGIVAPLRKGWLYTLPSHTPLLMVAAAPASAGTKGVVRQVIGPVLDVEFPAGKLPKILNALRIEATNTAGQAVALTAEVQQLLGDHRVRAVAMSATDGLVRGMEAIDTGAPISVPVGEGTLGRIFNVLGEPVDEQGPVKTDATAPIHRSAPKLTELETKPKVFETGIKVIDLLAHIVRAARSACSVAPESAKRF